MLQEIGHAIPRENDSAINVKMVSPTPNGKIPQASSAGLTRLASNWLDAGTLIFDDRKIVLQCSESLRKWLPASEPCGLPVFELFALSSRAELGEAIEALMENGDPFNSTTVMLGNGDQPSTWLNLELSRSSNVNVLRLSSALPIGAELSESSWEEHLGSEASHRSMFVRMMKAESRLQNLAERWPGIIFTQRPDFTFEFITPKIEELTGIPLEQWHKQSDCFWSSIHEADADELTLQLKLINPKRTTIRSTCRVRHVVTGKVSYILEYREAILTENGLLLGFEGVWLDITRQSIAEKRLSSAAWKETLAVLTMGLAHDFSNIVAGILALSESFQAELSRESSFYEGLGLIQSNARQASQLVQRILNLHQGKTGERSYRDVNELITDLTDLVGKIVNRRIRVETALAAGSLPVYLDPIEFRQVFINLALNAADAMPNGGALTFSTCRCHSFGNPAGFSVGNVPKWPAACIEVKDSGTGIPGHLLSSIFDPFFTTKATNKGSGLGLYNARLFIEKHDGALTVDSTEGHGSSFRVWMPETDFSEAENAAEVQSDSRHNLIMVGKPGKIMDSTAEVLRQSGFYVALAATEEKALELLFCSEYSWAVLLMLVSTGDNQFGRLLHEVHSLRIPIKSALLILSRNQDEMSPEITAGVDLLVPNDTSPSVMVSRIKRLVDAN
jgi:signal transduction histidine kinase